jgi:hypothetical protein
VCLTDKVAIMTSISSGQVISYLEALHAARKRKRPASHNDSVSCCDAATVRQNIL